MQQQRVKWISVELDREPCLERLPTPVFRALQRISTEILLPSLCNRRTRAIDIPVSQGKTCGRIARWSKDLSRYSLD